MCRYHRPRDLVGAEMGNEAKKGSDQVLGSTFFFSRDVKSPGGIDQFPRAAVKKHQTTETRSYTVLEAGSLKSRW